MKKILSLIFSTFLFLSCQHETYNFTEIDTPTEIAERAFNFAELYEQSETVYVWGGQDPVRSAIKIDCSGLIVMSYKYALVDTKYKLLENDMTANYMYQTSTIIDKSNLRKGDLIFMGEADNDKITHIAVFEKSENGIIYFIDSTQKDTNGDGVDDVNGVTRRNYSENDKRFKAFGIMRIKY